MIHLDRILQQRGIDHAARSAEWEPFTVHGQPGWKYPDRHYKTGVILGHRWKAANKKAARSPYLWIPGKPSDPAADFYILPGTLEAIRQANGECWQANGEPALLAFHEADIHNVITTTHSEATVPGSTLAVLRDLGITRLRNPADKDKAGRDGAINWRDYLAGSGIHYEALRLPDALPEKADFNDLWQFCQFDPAAARAMLDSLPALELPAPVPAPVIAHRIGNSGGRGRIDRERLKADIAARLVNTYHGKKSGQGIACRVPWRDDKKPSGSFFLPTGTFNDYGTGEKWQLIEVAERMGFNLDDYRAALGHTGKLPNRKRQTTQAATHRQPKIVQNTATIATPATAPVPRSWWNGAMPKYHRAAALHLYGVTAARIIEQTHAALLAGLLTADSLTVKGIAAVIGEDDQAVRQAVKTGYFVNFPIGFSLSPLYAISHKNPGGRPEAVYTLRHGDALNNRLFEALARHFYRRYFATDALPATLEKWLFDDEELGADSVPRVTGEKLKALNAELEVYTTEPDRVARHRYRVEMHGNKKWMGWRAALRDTAPLEIAPADATPKAYRAAILTRILATAAPDAPQHRGDLARVCGCTERTLDALYKFIGVKPCPNWQTVTIDQAGSAAAITKQIQQAQQQHRAKALHVNAGDVTIDIHDTQTMLHYLNNGHELRVILRAPSFLVPVEPADTLPESLSGQPAAPLAIVEPDEPDIDDAKPMPRLAFAERILWRLLERKGYERSAAGHIVTINGAFIIFHEPTLSDLMTVAANTAPAWKRFPQLERKQA